jgi:hypothetical protein
VMHNFLFTMYDVCILDVVWWCSSSLYWFCYLLVVELLLSCSCLAIVNLCLQEIAHACYFANIVGKSWELGSNLFYFVRPWCKYFKWFVSSSAGVIW